MAATGKTQEQLSRLSKAELIRRIEALRRKSQNADKGTIGAPQGGMAQRDGELLLKHAVQMANLGYWIWDDRENRCVYCSEQLARMNGMTVAEYLSKCGEYRALLEKTIHPDDRALYDEAISKAAERKEPYTVEFRGQREGGEIRHLREAGEPILDDQGELAHTVGILQDVTEAKHIEEALRASEARSRFIADESPVMLWMYDAEGNPTFFNRARLAFSGLTLEQALAYDLVNDIHPDDRAHIRALDYEDLLEPRTFQREYRLRRADGVYRWILDVGAPCFGPGGKFEGYSGYCIDFTETKRAQELLKEGDERFRAIADDLPVMIWAFDQEDRAEFFNRASLEFIGLGLDEALAANWYESIHPDDRERVRTAHEAWRESPSRYRMEYRERRADGAWRWILDIGVPRFDADGSLQGSIGCSFDTTEQKAAEAAVGQRDAQLREQQRELEQVCRLSAMGQLSGALSNEISEPLTAMMNYTAAARRMLETAGLPNGDRIAGLMDKAIGQARQASAVTRQMRDLFEKADVEVASQNINEIVDEALALASTDPARAGMHCELVLGERLPEVRVNKVQMQQVIFNLIKNGFEGMATAERRELVIETGLAGDGVVQITVSDSGPGLAPEVAARLFEPFVTSKQGGLGLGLAISHGIVEGYRGRLWAEPNPGGGTRFQISLPAASD